MIDTKRTERIYSVQSHFYDLIFGKPFHDSRALAVSLLGIEPGFRALEVGVGTGLSLPFYPRDCTIVGIDLAARMLKKCQERVDAHGLEHVSLRQMDAASMDFESSSFDAVLAAYTITAVPDPKAVLAEMIRTCKPGGRIVLLNHFRNGNRVVSRMERALSPLCVNLGFQSDLDLDALVAGAPLLVTQALKVKPFNYWSIIQCVNRKPGRADDVRPTRSPE